ncbi:MAG TPA: phytanoyl-CoA dioxygenase family protein [Vicinamibacterales bacterium]|nr:phytanoyl-CoA dioxygenase family protein [Vicinamibacterales bacterium]
MTVAEQLVDSGFAIVESVLDRDTLAQTRTRMYAVRDCIAKEVGEDRLQRAGELGVLRLMMRFDPFFFRFLEIPEVLAIVDATVSSTAILHLQNGFILPSFPAAERPRVFQNSYHQDFPRVLNGYLASVNVLFAIDDFTRENGATWVVPGTQHTPEPPSANQVAAAAIPIECPAGSMIVFDSTLWHAAGQNTSGADRLAINHQFTRSWIKQQIDYVRALGHDVVEMQRARTQQLLGWYTRVVTNLDEYYQPTERRLYRKGQG